MARNLISRRKLRKQVARMRRRVETLTEGLVHQQALIAGLRRQVKRLRRGRPGEAAFAVHAQQQAVARTADELIARVGGLERQAASAQRSGDELRERCAVIEQADQAGVLVGRVDSVRGDFTALQRRCSSESMRRGPIEPH